MNHSLAFLDLLIFSFEGIQLLILNFSVLLTTKVLLAFFPEVPDAFNFIHLFSIVL